MFARQTFIFALTLAFFVSFSSAMVVPFRIRDEPKAVAASVANESVSVGGKRGGFFTLDGVVTGHTKESRIRPRVIDANSDLPGQVDVARRKTLEIDSGNSIRITVEVGSPPQSIPLALSIGDAWTWVIDSAATGADCSAVTVSTFDSSASNTYLPSTKNFWYLNTGIYATETVTFAGFTSTQVIGVIQNVPYTYFCYSMGLLGLGVSAENNDYIRTSSENILAQLDAPLISMWIEEGAVNEVSTAKVTFGALDANNCKTNWKWVNVDTSRPNWSTQWSVPAATIEWGSSVSVTNVVVVLDTYGDWIGAPPTEFNAIANAISFNPSDLTFDCSLWASLPDVQFTFGSKVYTVPKEYFSWQDGATCYAHIYSGAPDWWYAGNIVLRDYCLAFDYGSSPRRVGFVKIVE